MIKLLALSATFAIAAHTAAAQSCNFTTECYEADACTDANFAITIDVDGEKVSTDFGDLTIVAAKTAHFGAHIFATGDGAEYLISHLAGNARLTMHSGDGPQTVTYLGTCIGDQ